MATPFTLKANPTFKAIVSIPRQGLDDGKLTIEFKHHTVDDYEKLAKKHATIIAKANDKNIVDKLADHLMELVCGWNLPDQFNRENLIVLMQNYAQAYSAISSCYHNELMEARVKN